MYMLAVGIYFCVHLTENQIKLKNWKTNQSGLKTSKPKKNLYTCKPHHYKCIYNLKVKKQISKTIQKS